MVEYHVAHSRLQIACSLSDHERLASFSHEAGNKTGPVMASCCLAHRRYDADDLEFRSIAESGKSQPLAVSSLSGSE